MASNRNQHYVPRCHLKPFTKNGAGLSINLFNLDRRLLIQGASAKKQCSGNYFYGNDPRLEHAIQKVERDYSAVRDAVHVQGYRLTDEDCQALRSFWLLQHLRTDAASRRITELANGASDIFLGGDPRFRMEIKSAVQEAMKMYFNIGASVSDLKVCLLRNRSAVPFITSDDPAVLANRLHQQHPNLRGNSFSLVSAGALLVLPLSPTVLCLGYDGDVYGIPHKNGWVMLEQDCDANALNEPQLLNAHANVFLKGDPHIGFDNEVLRTAGHRLDAKYRVTFMVSTGHTERGESFRVVSREEAEEHGEALVMWQQQRPTPLSWPQQIQLRAGAVAHTNGSVVGWVREAQRRHPSTRPFKKIRIN